MSTEIWLGETTKALIIVENYEGQDIAKLLVEEDGHLQGIGADIAYFLEGKIDGKDFDGPECLFVQLITRLKVEDGEDFGQLYLYSCKTLPHRFDYVYLIRCAKEAEPEIYVTRSIQTVFTGSPTELLKKIGKV